MPTIITFGQLASQAFGAMRRRLDRYFSNVVLLLTGRPVSGYSYIKDASTNNFALTVTGTVSPNRSNPFLGGYYSNYFSTSGTGFTGTATGGLVASTVTTWTAECWVYMTQAPTAGTSPTVLGLDVSSGSSTYLSFYVNSSQNVGILWFDGATKNCTTTSTVPLTQWTHIAASVNSNTIQLYINGALQPLTGTTTLTNRGGTTNSFAIAYQSYSTAYQFYGYISNARIVSGTAVYTNNFIPPTSPLTAIANTVLLTCQSNRFVDNSTYNYALTLVGTPTVSTNTPFSVSNASGYYSAQFNGTSQYLTVPANAAFGFGTGNFTWEAWLYISAATNNEFEIWESQTTGAFVVYKPSSGASNAICYRSYGGSDNIIVPTASIPYQQWFHLAVVRSGTNTVKSYLNGVNLATFSDSTNFVTPTAVYSIAARNGGTNFMPNGYISNLRIVNGTAVYTANFNPPTAPLTAITNTSLLTCQNPGFVDASTNAFQITPTSGPPAVPNNPFSKQTNAAGYWSGSFNGTSQYLNTTSSSSNYALGSGAYTVETWVYITGTSATYGFGVFGTYYTTLGWSLTLNMSTGGPIGVYWISGGAAQITTSAYVPSNVWVHIAVVRTSTATNGTVIYVNGTAVATGTDATNDTYVNNLYIGNQGPGSQYFPGYISNARFVKGTAVYTSNFTPPTSPLTAITNTQFLSCQNNTFIDNSTNAAAITNNGSATNSTIQPFGPPVLTPAVPTVDYSPQNQTTLVTNNAGYYSGYFDGSTGGLSSTSTILAIGTSSFTFECWVWSSNVSTELYPLLSAGGSNFRIFLYGAGIWYLNGSSSIIQNTACGIQANTWTHFALVRASGTSTFYVNGVSKATAADTVNFSGATTFSIGNESSSFMSGYISNLRFVVGTAVYTANFTPPTSPLTAITNTALLTCQNSTYIDNSTNSFTLTPTGKTQPSTYQPFTAVTTSTAVTPANYGAGLFGGSTNALTVANQPISTTANTFTVEAWIYPTATPTGTIPAVVGDNGSNYSNWSFGPTSSNTLQFYWYTTTGVTATGNTTILLNTWTHIAVSVNSGAISLYVNGIAQTITGTSTLSNRGTAGSTLAIGSFFSGSYAFTGYISNLRIVAGTALYTSSFIPPTAPLSPVTNTSLLTLQNKQSNNNNTFYDDSSNNFALTKTGTVAQGSFSPYSPTGWSIFYPALSYMTYAANPIGTFGAGATFTVEAWVNMSTYSATNYFFTLLSSCDQGTALYWAIGIGSTGLTTVYWYDGAVKSCAGSTALAKGTWYHVAVNVTAGVVKIYINGAAETLTGTTTLTNPTGNASYTTGCERGSSNGGSSGYISNLRTNTGALYPSAFTPSTTPLTNVANTTLLTAQSNRFVDNSSSAIAITPFATTPPSIQTFNPFIPEYAYNPATNGGSLYFNGNGNYLYTANNIFNIYSVSTAWTFECWIFPLTAGYFFAIGGGGAYGNSFNIDWGVGTANKFRAIQGNGSSVPVNITTSATYTAGSWYHVAVSRTSAGVVTIFVNGVADGTQTYTAGGFTAGTTAVVNGVYDNNGLGNTGGSSYISNLRFLVGTVLYISNFTPPTAPLTPIANTTLLLLGTNAGMVDVAMQRDMAQVGTVYTQPNTVKLVNGSNSGAVYFDGTSGYLTIQTPPNFSFGTANFTLEVWIYPLTVSPSQQGIVEMRTSNDGHTLLNLQTTTLLWAGGPANLITSTGVISANTWQHVAVVRNSGTTVIYVNGVSKASQADTSTYVADSITRIGATLDPYYFQGYMQELRITNGVARYTANFTPPAAVFPVI